MEAALAVEIGSVMIECWLRKVVIYDGKNGTSISATTTIYSAVKWFFCMYFVFLAANLLRPSPKSKGLLDKRRPGGTDAYYGLLFLFFGKGRNIGLLLLRV